MKENGAPHNLKNVLSDAIADKGQNLCVKDIFFPLGRRLVVIHR